MDIPWQGCPPFCGGLHVLFLCFNPGCSKQETQVFEHGPKELHSCHSPSTIFWSCPTSDLPLSFVLFVMTVWYQPLSLWYFLMYVCCKGEQVSESRLIKVQFFTRMHNWSIYNFPFVQMCQNLNSLYMELYSCHSPSTIFLSCPTSEFPVSFEGPRRTILGWGRVSTVSPEVP